MVNIKIFYILIYIFFVYIDIHIFFLRTHFLCVCTYNIVKKTFYVF